MIVFLEVLSFRDAYAVVQSLSRVRLSVTPWTAAHQGLFPALYYLLELAQTQVHLVGGAIQPPHPMSSPSPPAVSLSQRQGLF